jgi:plastocyanin
VRAARAALGLCVAAAIASGPAHAAMKERGADASAACHKATAREAVKQSIRTFYAHIEYAHLQLPPSQQVHAASDVSGYARLHASWLESAFAPLAAAGTGKQSCAQSPPPSPSPSPPPSSSSAQPTEPPAPAAPQEPASATTAVDIRDMSFQPVMLHVKRGTRVRWTNFDSQPHTVTSKDGNGPLDSPLLHKGDSWSYLFTKPGQYDYYCAVHPNMQAEVMVM